MPFVHMSLIGAVCGVHWGILFLTSRGTWVTTDRRNLTVETSTRRIQVSTYMVFAYVFNNSPVIWGYVYTCTV